MIMYVFSNARLILAKLKLLPDITTFCEVVIILQEMKA